MGSRRNPFVGTLTPSEKQELMTSMSYERFYGVRREVVYQGQPVPLEHGLGFKPDTGKLTVRIHYAFDDVGSVYCPVVPDDKYVYVAFNRNGRAWVEISHPPRRDSES